MDDGDASLELGKAVDFTSIDPLVVGLGIAKSHKIQRLFVIELVNARFDCVTLLIWFMDKPMIDVRDVVV